MKDARLCPVLQLLLVDAHSHRIIVSLWVRVLLLSVFRGKERQQSGRKPDLLRGSLAEPLMVENRPAPFSDSQPAAT